MANESVKKYYYVMSLVGGAVVVALLASLFIVKPLYSAVTTMSGEKDTMNTNLTELKKKQAALNALKDQESQLETDSQTVSNALPTSDDIGRLFIQLDTIAKASGGNLKSISGTTAATGTAVSGITTQNYSIPLDLPNYFALKQFITNAQGALRLLSIDNIKVDASDTGSLTVNMSAKSYSRGQ